MLFFKARKAGLTLLEIVVVGALIVFLVLLIVMIFLNYDRNSRDSAIKNQMLSFKTAADLYSTGNNNFYWKLCTPGVDKNIDKLRAAILKSSQVPLGCSVSKDGNSYTADVVLNTGQHYCVDASGFSGVTGSAPVQSGVQCK